MGKTMRWLKRILGGKGENKDRSMKSNNGEVGDKKRWSFATPRRSSVSVRHYEETKKPCMVLQKATPGHIDIKTEAAIKIQKAFRGHLARKALCALKSLVKLQALVRGYLVRKQMRDTIYRLQSLIRAQAFVNGSKDHSKSSESQNEKEIFGREFINKIYLPGQNQHSCTSLDSSRNGFNTSPKIIEMDTCRLRSRSSRLSTTTTKPSMHILSPLHCKAPFRLSMSNSRLSQEYSYCSKTAMNTPRCTELGADSPVLLTRMLMHGEQPSYMADTHSSVAKIRVRSRSVPRRRADETTPRWRRVSIDAVGPKESAFVGDANRRSCSQRKDDVENFGTTEYYLDKMW